MQNFLSHFNLMFSIFWFTILSIILILGLIVPLHYLFFYLFHLSFVPFTFLSSLILDQLCFILYFIFILYTCF